MDSPGLVAYCPSCSCTLGGESRYETVVQGHAVQHAGVTGHPVQVTDAGTCTALYTVPGAAHLPLWEGESSQ